MLIDILRVKKQAAGAPRTPSGNDEEEVALFKFVFCLYIGLAVDQIDYNEARKDD